MRIRSILMILTLLYVPSCAPWPFVGRPDVEYASLVEPFGDIDTSPLQDRVIVLDPGHGGRYPGAVGQGGYREADVNLAVAFKLALLLEGAGAQVYLTRWEDRDLVPPGVKPALRDDLQARVDIADSTGADLFLSLHHNAKADHSYNDTKIFYKMSDPGPSADAAKAIHAHLVRNLRIQPAQILPGNYYVLRNTPRPAILGEPSYLSNPRIERKLRGADRQLLEAQSYFLGILDYFSRGIPRIRWIAPADTLVTDAQPTIIAHVEDEKGGVGVDPHTITMWLDGQRVTPTYEAETSLIQYVPEHPLSNRIHTVSIEARNLQGNAALPSTFAFTVSSPPAQLILTVHPSVVPPDRRSRIRVAAQVLDRHGHPVLDGTKVVFRTPVLGDRRIVKPTRDGVAVLYVASAHPGRRSVAVQCGGLRKTQSVSFGWIDPPPLILYVSDGNTGTPLEAATLWVDGSAIQQSDREGYAAVEGLSKGRHTFRLTRQGYIAEQRSLSVRQRIHPLRIALQPMAGGVLHHRVILLDPVPGSEESLNVALYLQRYLRAAGAKVQITRDTDRKITELERIQRANALRPEIMLSIAHNGRRGRGVKTGYYPRSAEGFELARRVQKELAASLGWRDRGVYEDASYVVQQSPCPTVRVQLPSLPSKRSNSSDGRAEAYALYRGILRYFETIRSEK